MLLYKNKIKLEFQLLLDKTNEFRHSVILRLNFFNGHNAIAYKNFSCKHFNVFSTLRKVLQFYLLLHVRDRCQVEVG
jgi:hypothetical protein